MSDLAIQVACNIADGTIAGFHMKTTDISRQERRCLIMLALRCPDVYYSLVKHQLIESGSWQQGQ